MSSIERALTLLSYFTEPTPVLGLSELQRLSGRDKATVHRHLRALKDSGLVEQDGTTRAYRLGPEVERLAQLRRRTMGALGTLAPIVDALSRDLGELVHVSAYEAGQLHALYHADHGGQAVRVGLMTSWAPPLVSSSSGKAVLAYAPAAEQDLAIEAAALPPARASALRDELRRTAETGFATACDTVEVGVSSVGIAIFDAARHAVAACSVAYPTVRMSDALIRRAQAALGRAGPALCAWQGGTAPDHVSAAWSAQGLRSST